jgi:iron complex outermembrane receptor protein
MGKIYLVFSRMILAFFLITSFSFSLYSQRTIHGRVTDASTGEGLIGTNVVVIGSTVGTVTDFDGSYSLEVPEGSDMLSFSYTGYTTVEVKLTSADAVNVSLEQGKVLDEVVPDWLWNC